MHAPCDQLSGHSSCIPSQRSRGMPNTSASQDSTGNIEGGTDYLFWCSGSPRVISFGREVLPHSYLADAGPD
jgi:hypothetical protein